MHARSTGGTFIFTKNTFIWIQFKKIIHNNCTNDAEYENYSYNDFFLAR